MTKFAKKLIATFIIGIILIGIGLVITLFEFSAVTYGGIKTYPTAGDMTTETYTEAINEQVAMIDVDADSDEWETSVVTDESVKENQIIFEVTYPSDAYLGYWFSISETIYDDDENGYNLGNAQNSAFLVADASFDLSERNGLAETKLMMEDLKERKYYDYVSAGTLTIKVNPKNQDMVLLDF